MSALDQGGTLPPPRMAHFVIRTNRFAEMRDWYVAFFDATVVFDNGRLVFLAFDDEHHRLAIAYDPKLADLTDATCAVDHVAYSYDTLETLLKKYSRLKARGITPKFSINHGMTTSLYYSDPGRNKVELQVDNFATSAEGKDFFASDTFDANPIGVLFDPDLMVEKFAAGVPVTELLKQGSAPRRARI
jgi:catechol-2,3-dioxygenase